MKKIFQRNHILIFGSLILLLITTDEMDRRRYYLHRVNNRMIEFQRIDANSHNAIDSIQHHIELMKTKIDHI